MLFIAPAPSGPSWADIVTAIGTAALAVLAIGAIITVVFARRAFLKQSKAVSDQAEMLELQRRQLAEQEKTNAEQVKVLELQAEELRKSLEQREREAEDRRRSQAASVTASLDRVSGPLGEMMTAVLSNQSGLAIYDVQAYLCYLDERRPGSDWAATVDGASRVTKIVNPHSVMHLVLPRESSPYPEEDDEMVFAPSIIFTDAAGNRWERDPRGALCQIPPDEAYRVIS